MGFKSDFYSNYGHSYEAFRTWLYKHQNITIRQARAEDEIDFYINLYTETKLNSKFENREGFSHRAFATYIKIRYDMGLSEIPESSYQKYLDEYRRYRMLKAQTKEGLFDLLHRYVKGGEIELTESENELITYLEEN